ncbi:MAG: restriction endonuclease subunit S [Bacteroidales bacterium]
MAELTKYETYKPSGINWIEEVPEHWEVKRLKNTCSLIYGESLAEEIRQDGVIEVFGSNGKVGEHNISNTSAPCIIVGRKGSFGKVNYSYKKVFAIDTTYFIDDRFTKNQLRWLYYTLDIIGLDKLSKDTGVPGLNREDAYNEKLPLPPKPEQLAIANYLDNQTQKIDRLIANKKAQAERLKELRQIEINNAVTKGLNPNTEMPASSKVEMKDSGIDWLGKIPKHWEVKRLKNTTFINQSVISEKTAPDYLIKYIDISNVNSMGEFIELQEMEFSEAPSRARRIPKHNSILLSTVRTYLRAIALVQNPDKNLIASTGFAVIDANQNLFNASYLYFQMISHFLVESVIANSEGVSYPAISSTKLGDIKIVIPPINEQSEIANFLQQRTTAIDQLIKNIEAQIEKLQELRKIRIYEAVTGKIKVNAYAEKTA